MPERGELAAAVQTVQQLAVSRPEFLADGVALRGDGVVRPAEVSVLGHTRSTGRRE